MKSRYEGGPSSFFLPAQAVSKDRATGSCLFLVLAPLHDEMGGEVSSLPIHTKAQL